jgi:hypothetical protein
MTDPIEFNERVKDIVSEISYKDNFEILVRLDPESSRTYLQVQCWRPCSVTLEMGYGRGGKVFLSPYMVDGEIVRKAFQAILAYEEHEVREFFKYKNAQVFGPHIHIDALVEAAQTTEYRPVQADL